MTRIFRESGSCVSMMRRFAGVATLFALLVAMPLASVRADLLISIGDGSTVMMTSGEATTLDVMITSNNPLGDSVGLINYQFVITRISGQGQLSFNPAVDPISTSPGTYTSLGFDASNYLFYNNSAYETYGIPVGNLGSQQYTNDTFNGGDFAAGANTLVTPTTSFLFVRLNLIDSYPPGLTPDTFSIALVQPNSSDYSTYDTSQTTYVSDGGSNVIPYTSTSATVIVTNSVPEPCSLGLLTLGVLSAVAMRQRKSRNRRRHQETL
jgi:hypothetical protein